MNTNLLKEAIAEADAIKKMAIENAKASLNEAFDSKVKAMLAARLSEEADDAELEEDYEEGYDDKEKMDEKKHEEGDYEGYGMEEAEKDMESEEEAYSEGDEGADEAFDLDEIIAELEKGEKGEGDVMEGEDEDEDEDDEEHKEEPKEKPEEDDVNEANDDEDGDKNVDEEIDIAKLLAEMGDEDDEIKEGDDEDPDDEKSDKDEVAILEEEMMSLLEKIQEKKKAKLHKEKKMKEKPEAQELQEIKRQAAVLAQKVNETNLINAKLLYLNKILRKYNLSEQQKLKVISAFDKAGTTREAKIVHESLDQAFSVKNDNTKGSLKESIGFASKAAGTSTKRVINEGVITNADAQVSRWQKLAGIIK
jgi:hypothetical protein